MDDGRTSPYHQLYNRGHPVYFLPPSVPVQYESEQNEAPKGNEEERKERITAATSRARLSRACDNCRKGRFKCTKITGEELSPCTKCESLGEKCTYLRPRLRPGPITGVPRASTKTPTMFHEQRNVSAENYKHPDGPPPALGSWNFRTIQPRFEVFAPAAGGNAYASLDPGSRGHYCDFESGDSPAHSAHIFEPSEVECSMQISSNSDGPPTHSAQRTTFLRPMLWVRTENLNNSTTLPRNKKHLFVE
ncbi:hypothetical protein GYMLUDRAFT_46530 [Collybiopsis luxurians FD-317 M1]|uniref:Unplaced genomic scaffold GYMLUscaffold_44, whole genome shotgun sequence n=1 Tax=Collybiopsis luxurians FD-317 M1 TaxID=944289 RepID=A0A0D0BQ88_9AGAR|nr:hypothetical protein GYMLUDRAFT_46530 [Collybiopsis luxurians FD-317 M1]